MRDNVEIDLILKAFKVQLCIFKNGSVILVHSRMSSVFVFYIPISGLLFCSRALCFLFVKFIIILVFGSKFLGGCCDEFSINLQE